MNIRVMNMEDYDSVYALWMSCKGMGLNDVDDSYEGIERFLNRNPNTCFVCEMDGEIAGVIMAGHDGRRGWIYHTAVREEYRHQGIADEMVKTVISAMKKEGITKLALVVFERNAAGNAFWEKMGFTVRNDLVYRNLALKEMERYDN